MPVTPIDEYLEEGDSETPDGQRMMSFELKTGNFAAFSYAHLLWVTFNPSFGVILHFSTHTVTIEGSKLHDLYAGFLRGSVVEVKELAGRVEHRKPSEGPVIEAIHVVQKPGPTDGLTEEFSRRQTPRTKNEGPSDENAGS